MAIYHLSTKLIARSGGRSAVASAAYRAAEKLTNERDDLTHDFTNKRGVEHVQIILPQGVKADWARDRSALWNAAERSEKRRDARVAREFEVALPHELTAEQRLALTRAFAQDLADRYGAAVDFAIHKPHAESDVRNTHAHLMMTTRQVTAEGLGDKTYIERENRWLLANSMATSQMQLRDIRQSFEQITNRHLAMAGLDIRIDHRSYQERGLEIEPTEHMGVHATQLDRQGRQVSRTRIDEAAARRNGDLIREKPDQVLTLIVNEKSVFDRYDIARTLHRYINDDPQTFQNAFASVMASPALVELQPEKPDAAGGSVLARYSTREMVQIEHAMAKSANRMGRASGHGANRHHVDMAIRRQDDAIKASVAAGLSDQFLRGEISVSDRHRRVSRAGLSAEQQLAIEHVTGSQQIAAVVGFAGAGKSTMLAAARQAWEAEGYRVHGAALSGKAAEGLEESSGIASRTLASWAYSWRAGRSRLARKDVFVIDEAGMVGSRQLAHFVSEVEQAGAKLVLVGDHEQLQAIGAGAPFRAIVEQIGFAALSDVRRQHVDWQRQASIAFATHRTGEGLAAYDRHGDVGFSDTSDEARAGIVADYLADRDSRPDGTRIAMAHRRKDVRAINADIRAALQQRGELAEGAMQQGRLGQELTFETINGKRAFAPGDRFVFLENDRELGVRNGMLGRVLSVAPDTIQVQLDDKAKGMQPPRLVTVMPRGYQAFDHGYATTIHKTQGATVDRAFVLASQTMDRHLTYVSMTRHRDRVQLYAGRDAFRDNRDLAATLGRSGAKETTLDYLGSFTERRGMAVGFGIDSEIDLEPGPKPGQRRTARDEPHIVRVHQDPPAVRSADAERPPMRAGPDGNEHSVEKPPPLLPAVQRYDRSIEDVARDKAMPTFDRQWQDVEMVARMAFNNPIAIVASLRLAIIEQSADAERLAKVLAERPEHFGSLRGRTGMFGDNRERKEARRLARAVASHVASAGATWQRCLSEERGAEQWRRDKRDVVEVPDLTPRSAALLHQLVQIAVAERSRFIEQLGGTAEGRQALDEARQITSAFERRFGRSDPRDHHLRHEFERLGPELAGKLDRIKSVARLVDRAHHAELSQQLEPKRSLRRGLGLQR